MSNELDNVVTALITSSLRRSKSLPISKILAALDYKLSGSEVDINEQDLSLYVDLMSSLTLLHNILRGGSNNYETFNLDKLHLLKKVSIADKGLSRFQEKRKNDIKSMEPEVEEILQELTDDMIKP